MLNYTEILLTTYADRKTTLVGEGEDFTFTVHNPEWDGGDLVITCRAGEFTLDFVSMSLSLGREFGEVIEAADEVVHDEWMVFELFSHGDFVYGDAIPTAAVDIDHSIPALVRSLCEGDRRMHADMRHLIAHGACICRLYGWQRAHNRSVILS